MPTTLAELVRHFNLQPGQSVREVVNGITVELRLLHEKWTPGLKDLPDPIHIDESDVAQE